MNDAARAEWVRDASMLIDDLRTQWMAITLEGARPQDAVCAFTALGHAVGILANHITTATLDDEAYGAVMREMHHVGMPEFYRRHIDDLVVRPEGRLEDLCRRAHEVQR